MKPWHGAAPLRTGGDMTSHLGAAHRMVGARERSATRDLLCGGLDRALPWGTEALLSIGSGDAWSGTFRPASPLACRGIGADLREI